MHKNSVFTFFFLVNSQASGKQNTIPFRQIILYALKLSFSLYSRLKLQQGNSRPVSLWYPISAYLPCLRSVHSCSTGQVVIYFLRLVLSYSILIVLWTLSSSCGNLGSETSWSTKCKYVSDALFLQSHQCYGKENQPFTPYRYYWHVWDWVDGSTTKNTGFSSTGHEFDSQHQQDRVRLAMAPLTALLTPSFDHHWYPAYTWYTHWQNLYT